MCAREYGDGYYGDESSMLTGDLNLADVEWVVQYRIVDSYQYLFRVRNSEKTFRDMSEAAMRKVVGDRTVNEVLTVGRQEAASRVEVLFAGNVRRVRERYPHRSSGVAGCESA